MTRPRRAVPPLEAAAFWATLVTPRPDIVQVAHAVGISKTAAWRRLQRLRDRGLVGFEDGLRGSLHARYGPVEFGAGTASRARDTLFTERSDDEALAPNPALLPRPVLDTAAL